MSTPSKQVLLVGLPKAGKTTFIAAFWHVVSTDEIPESLRLISLGGDDEYLNLIRDSWISYQPLGRTSQQDESVPQMLLMDAFGARRCTLHVPDLSGETYRSQWVDREWGEKFDALAHESAALVVFIHPNQNIEPTEITNTIRLLPVEENGESVSEPNDAPSDVEPTEEPIWDPALANDVVQLVDILQMYQGRVSRPLRISLIVSAWDLTREYFKTPEEFVTKKLSLLDQYLRSNSDIISWKVFGVSATGTDLENKEACSALQSSTKYASERIEVVSDLGSDHDISKPIRWALEW